MKIKIGIIGLGIFFNKSHLPALKQLTKMYDVAYVYTSSPSKFKHFATHFPKVQYCTSVDDLLTQNIQAVVASVPIPKLFEIGSKVIKSGKHLLAEKPLTHSLKTAKEFVKLAKKYRVKVMIAESYPYNSSIIKAKDLLAKKTLGKLRFVNVHALHNLTKQNPYYSGWRLDSKTFPGILWDGGIHFVSMLRYLFNHIDVTYRRLKSINPRLGTYDTLMMNFKLAKKYDATLTLSYSMQESDKYFLKMYFEQGTVKCSMSEMIIEKQGKVKHYTFIFKEYERIYREFHQYIVKGTLPKYTINDAYSDIEILDHWLS